MNPHMDYAPYQYGELMETPLTSTSRLPSDGADDLENSHQMGPILTQMLEEFKLGDELLKREKKGAWSSILGRKS